MPLVYRVQPDAWLAGILGREAYGVVLARAEGNRLPEGYSDDPEPLRELLQRDVFASSKAPVQDLERCHFLESLGFRLIDTNVQFEKPVIDTASLSGRCMVRQAIPEDEEAVAAIAGTNIVFSRFHLDPRIPKAVADVLKAEWTRNFFRGTRGDAMVVAECEGGVAGFLQALRRDEGMVVIDLIAVDRRFRRRGVGRDMCLFVERVYPDTRQVRVGTQIANTPSLWLYTGLGYVFADAQYVFHHHGAGGGVEAGGPGA